MPASIRRANRLLCLNGSEGLAQKQESMISIQSKTINFSSLIYDAIFLLCITVFVFCAYKGNLELTANGAVMDSDLQTYAQDMAGRFQPELFKNDPVLSSPYAGVSIPNLQSLLADFLMPDINQPGSYAIGLLRAGACVVWLYYVLWYVFGRWLLGRNSLAAILALAMGVTVWVGWGTFWGVAHSDPVPRTLFAAVFPLLLILAILSVKKSSFRFLTMFLCGMCIWIHGISALNCGAMFFLAFLILKPCGETWIKHLAASALAAILFLVPVLIFLWPTLGASPDFNGIYDNELIRDAMYYRWHADFSDFFGRLKAFSNPLKFPALLIIMGIAAWLFDRSRAKAKAHTFCLLFPLFVLGLICVTAFCWLETTLSIQIGRMPQGHELVRGLRFLVPFSWIALAIFMGLVLRKWQLRAALIIIFCLLVIFTKDKQYMAAQLFISTRTGINLPLAEEATQQRQTAEQTEKLMRELSRIIPAGEKVFSLNNEMPVRYFARRPLVHIFKDGAMYFYSKDMQRLQRWFDYEKLLNQGASGLLEVWKKSEAPWLLIRQEKLFPGLLETGTEALSQDGWLLLHRKANAG